MSPQPTPLGQYQLIEKIAQGGMAEIFRGKALDAHGIEKPVVIKRILPHIAASPEFINMLVDEAKIAVMLSHGNIAQVYDLGKVADDYFIVMEYVEGKTLSQIMKRLQIRGELMPIPYALFLCSEVASGLGYMHQKKDDIGNPLHIVHRDISPQNIILSTSGTVKIIDFGIAKAKTKISTTDSGVVKGKFAYMSPEHAEGEKLDYRTDLFSLGVILFELLSGHRLFKGKNNRETLRNVKKSRIPPPSELREAIDNRLDQLVLKALERDREKRYQSAFAFQQAIARFLFDYYPDFSPQELSSFLKHLFPEEEPIEKKEKSGIVSVKTLREKEAYEETKILGKKVIKSLLSMADVYGSPSDDEIEEEEKKALLSPRPPFLTFRRLAIPFLLLFVVGGGWFLRKPIQRTLRGAHEIFQTVQKKTKGGIQAFQRSYHEITKEEVRLPAPTIPAAPAAPLPQVPPVLPVKVGTLRIESTPAGASIFLNDQELKKTTPAELTEIEIGKEQKIGLHLDRYRFWEGKFQLGKLPLQGEAPETLRASLTPNYGGLSIVSLPTGADVSLNGREVGKTPYSLEKIPPDTSYTISLKLPGYVEWNGGAKIFGGKKEVVSVSLIKAK